MATRVEFDQLVGDYLDGRADAETLSALEGLLRSDAALRSRFAARLTFEIQLKNASRMLPAQQRELLRRRWFVTAAAAALVAIVCGIAFAAFRWRNTPPRIIGQSAPSANLPAIKVEQRDVAFQPFSSSSPWNMPLGADAKYEAITSPGFRDLIPLLDPSRGQPIYVAAPTDPMISIVQPRTKQLFATMRVPADATPEKVNYHILILIDDAHTFALEMNLAERQADGSFTAWKANRTDLLGSGITTANTLHGTRIYGGSGLGGIIRKGELQNGIRHPLALSIPQKVLNANGPDGKSYVWPASFAGANTQASFGSTGNLFIGSLVALPPDVDVANLRASPEVREVARALQDYGGYIIERSIDAQPNFEFFAEPAAQFTADDAGLKQLLALLKVISNNAADQIGGGGRPRRGVAAPLIPHRADEF